MSEDETPRGTERYGVGFLAFGTRRRAWLGSTVLGICVALTVALLVFLLLDWARGPFPVATAGYDQFIYLGLWIDHLAGTSVFGFSSTWRALAAGLVVGLVAPLIGAFLIHRQMALIGETLAHTAFAGIAVGVVLVAFTGWRGSLVLFDVGTQGGLLLVALLVSVCGAVGLQWLYRHSTAYGDVPIAILLAGSFAAGSLLISWSRSFAPIAVDVEGFLFGSLAIVTSTGARLVAILSLLVLAIVTIHYKQFVFITFDEEAARVAGLDVDRYNLLLVVVTAVVVVGAMQILGVILVAAMLVVPAATASQISTSFRETVLLAVAFGQLAALAGLLLSLIARLPPGGSIVIVAIGCYVLAIVVGEQTAATSSPS